MPTYRYELQKAAGDLMAGQLAAESAAAAAKALRGRGGRIVRLVPFTTDETSLIQRVWKVLNAGSGPTKREILDFTTQLAVMIRAGIGLRGAIDGIASNTENATFRETLTSIKEDVEAGCSFSDALSQYPKLFSPLYINMVRASELSGSFGLMLDRIAKIITRQIETRKLIIGASIYPAVIGGLATVVTIFLLTFVLPRFAGVFAGKEEVLPWPTIFLMGLSEWMVSYWWLVPIGIFSVVLSIFFGGRTDRGRSIIDSLKLRLPLIRRMLRALYINRSLQTFGELLNAGVPMLSALEVTGDISGNRHYKSLWYEVRQGAREGSRIATTTEGTKLLPKPVIQMIDAGEESGRLGDVLQEVADYYDRVLRDAVKTFTSLLEPTMIVLMGGVVGFIAMAIILPIFKMSAVVSS
ncbi:MAG: type II secretion system F family protein [Phycisphaerales bacterium]|jgi:type IV pilus assembly protein PilC|nr:type II secretion system F family protein [Phycisphaerales bacterium]MDP6693222.1 type II secretion system F family protein [Phycisphaerales bacterium]